MTNKITQSFGAIALPLMMSTSGAVLAQGLEHEDIKETTIIVDENQGVHNYFDINLMSRHDPFERERTHYKQDGELKPFNEQNLGLGFTRMYDIGGFMHGTFRAGWSVGFYENSYDQTTVYGSGNIEQAYSLSDKWEFSAGIMAGGLTGYEHISDMAVTPGAQFYSRLEYNDRFSVKLGYTPEIEFEGKTNPSLATLQASYKF